jgi:DNA-binding NarL/FixJ family response regulator
MFSTDADHSMYLGKDNRRPASITGDERIILIFVSKGSSDKEIGRLLHMEPHQVAKVVDGACAKLGLKSRLAAAIWAIKNRLDAESAVDRLYPVHPLHPPPAHLTAI